MVIELNRTFDKRKSEIENTVKEFIKKYNIDLSQTIIDNIVIHLSLCVSREINGSYIHTSESQIHHLKHHEYYIVAKEIILSLEDKFEVSIDKAKSQITSVKVVEYAGETEGYGLDLIEGKATNEKAKTFYDKVLKGKLAIKDVEGVDTATGATITSKGIIEAIQQAIEKVNAILVPNKDGFYEIKTNGFGGENQPMTVLVKVKGDNVTVKVKEYAGETEGYGLDLIEGKTTNEKAKAFYDKYLKSSFKKKDIEGVDTATGATMTTKGIVEAIEKAIAAAQ